MFGISQPGKWHIRLLISLITLFVTRTFCSCHKSRRCWTSLVKPNCSFAMLIFILLTLDANSLSLTSKQLLAMLYSKKWHGHISFVELEGMRKADWSYKGLLCYFASILRYVEPLKWGPNSKQPSSCQTPGKHQVHAWKHTPS